MGEFVAYPKKSYICVIIKFSNHQRSATLRYVTQKSQPMTLDKITAILGAEKSDYLLQHHSTTFDKSSLHLPSPNFVDDVWSHSNRNIPTLRSLQMLYNHGRLGGTGYVSILPVDQGLEHTAGASFAPNPAYFDSENIVKLAIEAGCNAVASTYGVLASVARKYAHKIPFVVKINHNELMTYPNKYDQILYGSIKNAWEMGAVAVGATIYFGSENSNRQIMEVAEAFEYAHELGMATILWCYTRNSGFKKDGKDYHAAADLTGQANHIGATIQADIVKQKLPVTNSGFTNIGFAKTHKDMYEKLATDHPIDLCRYQVAHGYMGRVGLINSGGASGGNDLQDAVETAVINKRAGGMGLILGRKAFQKPLEEGINIINAVQDVYLCNDIKIA